MRRAAVTAAVWVAAWRRWSRRGAVDGGGAAAPRGGSGLGEAAAAPRRGCRAWRSSLGAGH